MFVNQLQTVFMFSLMIRTTNLSVYFYLNNKHIFLDLASFSGFSCPPYVHMSNVSTIPPLHLSCSASRCLVMNQRSWFTSSEGRLLDFYFLFFLFFPRPCDQSHIRIYSRTWVGKLGPSGLLSCMCYLFPLCQQRVGHKNK